MRHRFGFSSWARLCLSLGVWVLAAPDTTLAQVKRPNVVLMLADNLGFGDLSAYNGGTRGGMRTSN